MFDTKTECVFIVVGKLLIEVEHLELPSLGHEEAAPHPGHKKKSERPQRGPRDYLRYSTSPWPTLPTTGRSAQPYSLLQRPQYLQQMKAQCRVYSVYSSGLHIGSG